MKLFDLSVITVLLYVHTTFAALECKEQGIHRTDHHLKLFPIPPKDFAHRAYNWSTGSKPQQPEINDQFELNDQKTVSTSPDETTSIIKYEMETSTFSNVDANAITIKNEYRVIEIPKPEPNPELSLTRRAYKFISAPILNIVKTPKVNQVLRNIGTCLVNGAMELISFYLPAPIMPLIASAAGLLIPFEPVVMLKEKMPVTSYRRAFQTAMKTFLGTFDTFKPEEEYDPYMTRRFNRRFMNDGKENKRDMVVI